MPKEKCATKKEVKCEKYTVDVPQTKTRSTCHWPAKQPDRFCTRRSDTDVFLDAGSDYSEKLEYLGKEIDDEIDYLNVFPANFQGNPNDTATDKGSTIAPQFVTAAPNYNIDTDSPLKSYPDVGNEDYTFPNNYNTSGVLKEVEAPTAYAAGRLYHSLDIPADIQPFSSFYPNNAQTQDTSQFQAPAQIAYSADVRSRAPVESRRLPAQDASDFNPAVQAQSTGQGFFPDNMADIFKTQISNGFADAPGKNLWKRKGGAGQPKRPLPASTSTETVSKFNAVPFSQTQNNKYTHKENTQPVNGKQASRFHYTQSGNQASGFYNTQSVNGNQASSFHNTQSGNKASGFYNTPSVNVNQASIYPNNRSPNTVEPQLHARTFTEEKPWPEKRSEPTTQQDIHGFDDLSDFWPEWGAKLK